MVEKNLNGWNGKVQKNKNIERLNNEKDKTKSMW